MSKTSKTAASVPVPPRRMRSRPAGSQTVGAVKPAGDMPDRNTDATQSTHDATPPAGDAK